MRGLKGFGGRKERKQGSVVVVRTAFFSIGSKLVLAFLFSTSSTLSKGREDGKSERKPLRMTTRKRKTDYCTTTNPLVPLSPLLSRPPPQSSQSQSIRPIRRNRPSP